MKPFTCFNAGSSMATAIVRALAVLAFALPACAFAQAPLNWPADPFAGNLGEGQVDSTSAIAAAPHVLFSSFFGGGFYDTIKTIRTNAAGEFYIAGATTSDDMPTTPGADQIFGGGILHDGFVAKFSASGLLIYSTYIGNNADDFITGMALDAAGNAFVVGYSLAPLSTDAQAFVIKVTDTGGGHLTFIPNDVFGGPSQSPYYGGDDRATDIAIDSNGNVIVVGYTSSAVGFTQLHPINPTLGGSLDGFIRRYDSNLTLLSSTYIGGPNQQQINAVDVGAAGNITIAGWDNNWGTTLYHHAWVARIKADVSQVLWASTFIGNAEEEALDVRVSSSGDALVGGWTRSTDFSTIYHVNTTDPTKTTYPGLDQDYGGNQDGFLLVAGNVNGALRYSSYVGEQGIDTVHAVERGSNNDIIVIGDVQSNPSFVTTTDVFLRRFNNVMQVPQSLDYWEVFGSNSSDSGLALTKAANGSLYLAGIAGGSDFAPISPWAFRRYKPGVESSFFMRLDDPEEGSDTFFANGFE